MWIYKIICDITNKVYIGQTKRSIQQRFNRHINDAVNNLLDTHFARATRKYGPDHFSWVELESGITDEYLLTIKEQYWIQQYDSVKNGYNETDALYKCGGNTYMSKTEQELDLIKDKIRKTKIGDLNPRSVSIKMINIQTKEEKVFSSQKECANFLGLKGHYPISKRCRKEIKSSLNGIYNFEYLQ